MRTVLIAAAAATALGAPAAAAQEVEERGCSSGATFSANANTVLGGTEVFAGAGARLCTRSGVVAMNLDAFQLSDGFWTLDGVGAGYTQGDWKVAARYGDAPQPGPMTSAFFSAPNAVRAVTGAPGLMDFGGAALQFTRSGTVSFTGGVHARPEGWAADFNGLEDPSAFVALSGQNWEVRATGLGQEPALELGGNVSREWSGVNFAVTGAMRLRQRGAEGLGTVRATRNFGLFDATLGVLAVAPQNGEPTAAPWLEIGRNVGPARGALVVTDGFVGARLAFGS